MKNGVCMCPSFEFIHFNNNVVGINNRSTTAVSKSIVNGIPIKAYTMQNTFPDVERGDWWPYPEIV